MITAIRMVNCQSIKDITLEFAKGKLNIIAADKNNKGKSVLFRMLRVTLNPKFFSKERQRKLIRRGCDYAEIVYLFDDESFGITRVYPDGVQYAYSDDGTNESCRLYNNVPLEMVQKMGFIAIDSTKKFVPNIFDEEQDLALISLKDGSDVGLLNYMLQDQNLETLIDRTGTLIKDWSARASQLDLKIRALENSAHELKYVDADALEEEIKTQEAVYATGRVIQVSSIKLRQLLNLTASSFDYDFAVDAMKLLEIMEEKLQLLKEQKVLKEPCDVRYADVLEVVTLRSQVVCRYAKIHDSPVEEAEVNVILNNVLNSLVNVKVENKPLSERYADDLIQLEDINNKVKSIIALSNKKLELEQEIQLTEKEFVNSCTMYDCPIYRKVVYDGKECVPCDT